MTTSLIKRIFFFIGLFLTNFYAFSQWTNRYPHVNGFGHHVYLEGYELPIMNAGPTSPAPSPDNRKVVIAAKGWLWLLDLQTSTAERITSSMGMDSQPDWSPTESKIVFVRDDSEDTKIMVLDFKTGEESVLVDTPALDLNPIFSQDGNTVYYVSATDGYMDLWRFDMLTKKSKIVSSENFLQRMPTPLKSEDFIIYLKKIGFSYDSIELLNLPENRSNPVAQENFGSQISFSLASDDRTLCYTWPQDDFYELRLIDVLHPESNLLLTKSEGLPLNPKFSMDDQWIYFTESNSDERMELKRISINGGMVENIPIKNWDWNQSTAKLTITSKVDGNIQPVRMSITDKNGHPIIPENGIIHSEGQNGIVFFYSPGQITIEAPIGELIISAVHGFSTVNKSMTVELRESSKSVDIVLDKIWNPQEHGWYSGDNHFHINYGGTSQLDPEDIVLDLRAEDLDVAFPLLANLGNRFLQQNIWEWKRTEVPLIQFGQEVRSHFLGHLGLLGTKDLFWPWVWGPSYDVYGRDDRLNAEPLRFANNQEGLAGYVHPVSVRDPFGKEDFGRLPTSLIADCVLGEADYIELGCLWSDELGTAKVWHNLLNIGIPLTISAGSDVMNDLYRTMAIGASRVYVKPKTELTMQSYLEAIKAGRSFVTTGPLIDFKVEKKLPGDIVQTDKSKIHWELDVHSSVPYEKIEIIVNGEVMVTKKGNSSPGTKTYNGKIQIPLGGWITARAYGGNVKWPLMDSYPYAETSPIWFHDMGSVEVNSAKKSARNLLSLLEASEERLKLGYRENNIPNLLGHFEKARKKLVDIINQ